MIVEAKCKFCQVPLRLIVEPDYDLIGKDPLKLLPLASCDRCANYRVRRRLLVNRLKHCCELLARGQVYEGEEMDEMTKTVEGMLKTFVHNLAYYRKVPEPDWDEALTAALMSKPERLGEVLSRVPTMFRQEKLL